MVFTNQSRNASKCLQNLTSSLKHDKKKKNYQTQIVSFVSEGKRSLQAGDYKTLGNLLTESYKLKKDLNNDKYELEKNSDIDNIEELLKNNSIYGYKVIRAY